MFIIYESDASTKHVSFKYNALSVTVNSRSEFMKKATFSDNEYVTQEYIFETDNTNVNISFNYSKTNGHKDAVFISIFNGTSTDQKVNVKYAILYIII